LIDALGRRADIAFADHDAVCDARRVLNDDIEPAARRVFGVQAGASWVATLGRRRLDGPRGFCCALSAAKTMPRRCG